MNEIPRANPDVRKELARDARSLQDDPAFKAVVNLLRKQWYGELVSCPTEKLVELRARLQALDAIPQMLDHLMNSEKMAQRGSRG